MNRAAALTRNNPLRRLPRTQANRREGRGSPGGSSPPGLPRPFPRPFLPGAPSGQPRAAPLGFLDRGLSAPLPDVPYREGEGTQVPSTALRAVLPPGSCARNVRALASGRAALAGNIGS